MTPRDGFSCSSKTKETPRLCRGGSSSLTFKAVVYLWISEREPPRTRKEVHDGRRAELGD